MLMVIGELLMSGWVKDGERVTAEYLGVRVTGVVESSRVKYGGKVQYAVVLDSPVTFPWSTEPRTKVLIDCNELVEA
jgi:hypothetical protein